ncbi:hypothetical protein [Pelodictyon phaeoclathratiforme]|uniref:hypothetical protein n=1 Tax=Pelodictyon phaeoclathratiforme TaxID=34090 RepID=UPI00005427C9|nr:hypothetical protein [Pelodictyon phaeoclathratiforme]MBV5289459.1 hypothetical protein [Pelodictyon phaeoclathratiforme]
MQACSIRAGIASSKQGAQLLFLRASLASPLRYAPPACPTRQRMSIALLPACPLTARRSSTSSARDAFAAHCPPKVRHSAGRKASK